MLRHHVDAWKFMGYCDRERDFAQRIALCKKKIARANSVPGRAEPRQLSKAPVDTPECVVWPLRAVKPWGEIWSTESCGHLVDTVDMELRLQAHHFTAACIDKDESSANIQSSTPTSCELKAAGAQRQHMNYNCHQESAHELSGGSDAFNTRVRRLPPFIRKAAIIDNDWSVATDIDLQSAPCIIGNMIGRFEKYSTCKQHAVSIPRALLASRGELYLLFDCCAKFPLYWADERDLTITRAA